MNIVVLIRTSLSMDGDMVFILLQVKEPCIGYFGHILHSCCQQVSPISHPKYILFRT